MTIRILVNGAMGKMGQISCATIKDTADLQLVATTEHEDDLVAAITRSTPQVVVDFTQPDSVFVNAQKIIAQGVSPVIGTTGLNLAQISELQTLCKAQSLGGIIAPNFSLAAALMMKYAQDAAHFLPNVEIIEMHHLEKVDAPSGTAIKTAALIEKTQQSTYNNSNHVPIHSVRLPGYFAHQAVIFGDQGETLSIRHDAITRDAMMPGLILACRTVQQLSELIYGMENLLPIGFNH